MAKMRGSSLLGSALSESVRYTMAAGASRLTFGVNVSLVARARNTSLKGSNACTLACMFGSTSSSVRGCPAMQMATVGCEHAAMCYDRKLK